MTRGYTGKCVFGWVVYQFIRPTNETDAGLYKIYWRIGSRFSADVGVSDLKGVHTSYESSGREEGFGLHLANS